MLVSGRDARILLLAGVAAVAINASQPAVAQTICTQAADGSVECAEDGTVVATGTMTAGTVVNGPGLAAGSDTAHVEGTIVGTITTESDNRNAVQLSADSGVVRFDHDGAIIATGSGATGLSVYGYAGVDIDVGNITAGIRGISTYSEEGGISVTVGDISIDGSGSGPNFIESYGVSVITEWGSRLTCGNVSTTGDYSLGILVSGDEANDIVTCGNVTTAGTGSTGARLSSSTGRINAQLGNVTTHGDAADAVILGTFMGSTLAVGNVTTTGVDSDGIFALVSEGNLTLTAGDVTTTGVDSTAVEASTGQVQFASGGGNLQMQVGNVSTTGSGSAGILATALTDSTFAAGDLTLTASDVSTAGDDSPAIVAIAGGSATVTANDVSTLGARSGAVFVDAGADATVTLGNVTTSGVSSRGIDIDAGADSIFDEPFGDVSLTCASVTTTGADSTAIRATSNNRVDISCGDIRATGAGSDGVIVGAEYGEIVLGDVMAARTGVHVNTLDFGGITVDVGDVLITGDGGTGISASARDGGISITCDSITTLGDNSVGIETSASDGGVFVTCGDIRIEGDGGAGAILVETNFALGDITTLGQGTDGLLLAGNFSASGTVGDIVTTGDNAFGIASYTDTFLTVGSVTTGGDGSVGIYIDGYSVDFEVGQVTTTGSDAHGIVLDPFGTAGTMALSIGGVHVSGEGADAIQLRTEAETWEFDTSVVDPTITGDIISEQGTAILLGSANTFNLSLAEALTISGATGGIVATANQTNLDISGTVQATEGPAIQALGGDVTLNIASTGSVSGFLTFGDGDGDDTVTNAGLFTASGTSDFGGGQNLFTNGNMVVVNGDVTFAGLDSFTNSGATINMQDGAPDDRLTLGGDLIGGDGSAVLLDVSRSLDVADVLSVGADLTGGTILDLNWVDSTSPLNAGGVLLVDGVADADLFTVEGLEDFGLFALTLRERDGDLYLMAAIDPAASDLLLLGAVAPDSWYQSFDAIRASIAGRGSVLPKLGFWAQAYGGSDRSGETGTAELFGMEMDVSSRLETDRLGAQVGIDGSVGAVLVGATAGYASASSDAGLASDLDAKGWNLGGYAGIGAAIGPYATVTVKHDRMKLDFDSPTLEVPELDASSIGADLEAGFRGSLVAVAFDVNAGVSVVRSEIDDFTIDGTRFVPRDGTSVRGRVGARAMLNGPLRPFAEARLFREFGDNAALAVISGDLDEQLSGAGRGTWARIEAGIGGGKGGPLLSAWADIGDREGWGLRAGFRF